MIYPPCPVCGDPVRWTEFDSADWYRVVGHPDAPPRPIVASAAQRALSTGRFERTQVDGAYGAPDHDQLTLHPCWHTLVGPSAHGFNLAGLNMTWPDLTIQVKVTLPAGVPGLNETDHPVHLANVATFPRADLIDADDPADLTARTIHTAAQQVATMIDQAGADHLLDWRTLPCSSTHPTETPT
jgi:hypothetical protein